MPQDARALRWEAIWDNPKTVESAIKRLTREIEEIDRFFYHPSEHDDCVAHAGMLERKRDDMVRSIVLQLHTSIESLLDSLIAMNVLGNDRRRLSHTDSGQALQKMLFGAGSLGFEMKLNLARALRLISTQTKDRLAVLNTLRNKCSHNWLLKVLCAAGNVRHRGSLHCSSMKAVTSTASPPSKTLSVSTPSFT
jgi:superfamily II helicase